MNKNFCVVVLYKGYSSQKDQQLEKIAGRRCDGSGYYFYNSLRDLTWDFKKKFYANRLVDKFKSANVKGLKVKILED